MDETYVKVRGLWAYLYRALDKHGDTIDFHLSPTRNAKGAKCLLNKAALRGLRASERSKVTNTDKAPTFGLAIAALKKERNLSPDTQHRQVQYLNNIVEADHGKLKRLTKPTLGFQSLKTAFAVLKGFEVMRAQDGSGIALPHPARHSRRGGPGAWGLRPCVTGQRSTVHPSLPSARVCNGAFLLHTLVRLSCRILSPTWVMLIK